MKRNYLEWFLLTAGGALVGALAVDLYRKHKAAKEAVQAKSNVPKEFLIIEKL
jgi:hypothetical protein